MAALVGIVVVLAAVGSTAGSPQLLSELHEIMSPLELRHFLGHKDGEYELIYLRVGGTNSKIHKRDTDTADQVEFEAFGRPYSLRLDRNQHLLHAGSRIVRRFSLNVTEEFVHGSGDCHFLHSDSNLTAAISSCRPGHLRGFVSDGQNMLDITPLNSRLSRVARLRRKRSAAADDDEIPHLVRLTTIDQFSAFFNAMLDNIDVSDDFVFPSFINPSYDDLELKGPPKFLDFDRRKRGDKLTLELGLYVDKPARETFLPFFDNDLSAFVDFILGFINQIQALYYLPSLGPKVDITINYLEVMEVQSMRHYGGERGELLTSFCQYNALLNKKAKDNQWDMGLYLSGLNFYAIEGGRKSPVTMGLAVISGVCSDEFACVIGELGVTNDQGKPYPSAGFTAAYIMAHEIGHNLGMNHDSQGNACPSNGFIMSPSRGTQGETTWSSCSRQVMLNMPPNCLDDKPLKRPVKNHRIFRELPGQVFDAYDQCQLFLRDKDAELFSPESLKDVCTRVKCKSPNRIGYYYAGPALEGTFCGDNKWCISGGCRAWSSPAPTVIEGGWGDWNVSECTSGCTTKASGVSLSTRRCDNPKPLNTESRCTGASSSVQFCDDTTLCHYRLTAKEFASQKCREFSQLVKDIRTSGVGIQVPHTERKPWSACSIYCRLNSGTWYTPRQDLNDMGVDTYFPDGTWCHKDRAGIDYYCQQHQCRPKVRPLGPAGPTGSAGQRPPPLGRPILGTTPRPAPVYPPQWYTTTTRRPSTTQRPWWARPTSTPRPWTPSTTTTRRWWTVRPATSTRRTTTERPWFVFVDGRWQQVRPPSVTRFPPRATRWPPRRAARGATVDAGEGGNRSTDSEVTTSNATGS